MGQGHHHSSTQNIKAAFFLNLLFSLIELIGGLLTNSTAILADALHDLGDSISLGLAWYFQKLAGKPSNQKFSYGYRRFSVLGALINSIILIIGSCWILMEAVTAFQQPHSPHATGMMGLALLGILVNGLAAWRLQRGKTLNEKVVYLHLLEDVLGWVATLIVAILLHFTDWVWLDPFAAVLIASFILYNISKHLRSTLHILMQGTPDMPSLQTVKREILNITNVMGIHDCHIWSVDGEDHVFTAHIVVTSSADTWQVKQAIKEILTRYHFHQRTLEIEQEGEQCHIKE